MSKKDKKSANANATNRQHDIIRRLNDLQPSKRKSAKRRPKDDGLGWVSEMEVVLTEDERDSLGI